MPLTRSAATALGCDVLEAILPLHRAHWNLSIPTPPGPAPAYRGDMDPSLRLASLTVFYFGTQVADDLTTPTQRHAHLDLSCTPCTTSPPTRQRHPRFTVGIRGRSGDHDYVRRIRCQPPHLMQHRMTSLESYPYSYKAKTLIFTPHRLHHLQGSCPSHRRRRASSIAQKPHIVIDQPTPLPGRPTSVPGQPQ